MYEKPNEFFHATRKSRARENGVSIHENDKIYNIYQHLLNNFLRLLGRYAK